MNDDLLKQLLQEADAKTGFNVQDANGLSLAVRRRLRQRRQRMRAGMLTAATVLAMAAIGSGLKYRSVQNQRQIAALQQGIILAQMETAKSILQDMLEEEQARFSGAQESEFGDPIRQIEEQVDETAFVLMYQAQRMADVHKDKETALELYRQVTEHFGQTQWAKKAKEKIAELQPNQT